MGEKSISLYKGVVGELIEKKSRFIVTTIPVKTPEEAMKELDELRKKYWNASHNCFAYVIGENGREQRCSDDGEPSGTAGKPMLDVINGRKITNILLVVTRYFGGVELGTGGLVRAYSQTAKLGIDTSVIIEKEKGQILEIKTDYNGIGKVQYILGQRNITIINSVYTENVNIEIIIQNDLVAELVDEIIETTSGKAEIKKGKEKWFALVEGEVMFF